jgi:D-alanyl-D-alanine carboxypeptidase/D-alanyl-D-alanine-endopeptidase (penicillin-binding protein 4)
MKQTPFRLPAVLILVLATLLPACPAQADLAADIQAFLRDKSLARATVGVEVVRLGEAAGDSRILFSHRAEAPLIPASNMKLVTTASALDHLGADFKFQTLLVRRGTTLYLVGDGDPTFGDGELLRRVGWDITTVYERWAAELKKAGLGGFEDILLDDTIFDTQFIHPNWEKRNLLARYSPGVAGMMLNQGVIDFSVKPQGTGQLISYATFPPTRYVTVHNTCVGGRANAVILDRGLDSNKIALRGTCPDGEVQVSITVHDPGLFAVKVLEETLRSSGLAKDRKWYRLTYSVRPKLLGPNADPAYTLLAVHETPLVRALEGANKDSINPYAESLCKRVGFAVHGSGTWANGTSAAAALLRRIGVPGDQFTLDDGSGLSRENRLSAGALCRLLEHQYHGRNREVFLSSLAIGGQDGTLEDRFRGPLAGRVLAKSGYINGVSALSGYLRKGPTAADEEPQWYAFSILMNGITANWKAKELQEGIVKAIDDNAATAASATPARDGR